MVMNVAAFLEGEERYVRDDIEAVVLAVPRRPVTGPGQGHP